MTKLCVYIEGQREMFGVTISPNNTIYVLKEQIKEKWSNLLLRVDAPTLTLTKVDVDLGEVANNLKTHAIQYPPDPNELLYSRKKIFEVWPSPPSRDRLHVFVGLPAAVDQPSLKRRRLSDAGDLEAPSPWLKEFHSKMWNKKNLEKELFRTVKVTRVHFDELQRRLNDRNPDRNDPEYDASEHNILSDKLDFLRSIAEDGALPPLHPDDNEVRVGDDDDPEARNENEDPEACDEGDSEINSFFPFTLTYLDFSILELNADLELERFPPALLVRQEYNHISNLINERQKNGAGSVIFSGQPGTGKTVYLYLRVIECLIEGRPFLYQTKEGDVYHVAQNGVEAVRDWPLENPKTHIMAFVDGDKGDCEPKNFLLYPSVQIIVATSRGVNQKWLWQLQSNHEIIFTELATDLWSPRELFLTGIFLYSYDISVKLLRESTSYFGYNPHRCFNASHSMAILKSEMVDVMGQIRGAAKETAYDFMRVLQSVRMGGSNVAQSIFQLFPANELRHLSECHFDAVSPWALDVLLKQCQTREADAAAPLCHYLSGEPDAALLRGRLFERQVLTYLDNINTHHALTMRRLTDSEPMSWIYRGPIPRFTFQEPAVIAKIKNVVETNEPLHLVPSAPNFPAVDSIIYYPKDVLTCIQITINSHHPISVSGLRHIQSWLKLDTPPADLHPKNTRPWRFIFVVPSDMAPTFTLQNFEGDTANGEWAGMVDQYVLGLEF